MAVVRLNDKHEPVTGNSSQEVQGLLKLVDVLDNQYVLAKSKDTTIPIEDHHLIMVGVILDGVYICYRKVFTRLQVL